MQEGRERESVVCTVSDVGGRDYRSGHIAVLTNPNTQRMCVHAASIHARCKQSHNLIQCCEK